MSASAAVTVDHLVLKTTSGRTLVNGVSFEVAAGESLGLVGESGSGKSLSLRAVLGLLPAGVVVASGRAAAEGRCAMVFQDPIRSLDPLYPVVAQVAEVVRHNQQLTRAQAQNEARALLERLGLPEAVRHGKRYPRQLSGGQCQRIGLALALARRPQVLLCDEPTTALDVTVQRQILEVISQLQDELGFALVFVTHNLAVASSLCSRLVVLKDGVVVEQGPTSTLIATPHQPYTRMLISSVLTVPPMQERA